MATHSTEFVWGLVSLALGILSLLMHWILPGTRFGKALKQVEREAEDEGLGRFGMSNVLLAAGVVMLIAGSVLTLVAFIAYERP
jgi:hypothetical protein